MNTPRSLLFVPGNRPDWAEKALRSGPDAIVLDLEDSVPPVEKETARDQVRNSIGRIRDLNGQVVLLVRVNPLSSRLTGGDLEAVVSPGLDGLFLPKVETQRDLVGYDALVDHFEVRNGVKNLRYVLPVETVPAIQNCRDIAKSSSRVAAMIGPTAEHADIAREVGFEWTPEGLETLYLRSRVLLACREAGIHPLTALWERIDDLDGLLIFAKSGRRLGFRGMVAIHPSHVAVINHVFSPTAEELEFYRGMISAYNEATAEGHGAVRYRGLHVDRAHYDKALLVLGREGQATRPERAGQ